MKIWKLALAALLAAGAAAAYVYFPNPLEKAPAPAQQPKADGGDST